VVLPMNRTFAGLAAIALVMPALMIARDGDLTSWQNLEKLAAGQAIEVAKTNGASLQGTFVSFVDQSITLRGKQQEIVVPRPDVTQVRLRSHGGRGWTWIAMAAGASAGLGVGAGIGESVATESGGDFRNLKPAIIGVSGGIGALVGALIGSSIDRRRTTIYRAK